MAHKYQMDKYLAWAIKILKTDYPTTKLSLEQAFKHHRWTSANSLYRDVRLIVRFIETAELLSLKELAPTIALAYYALSAIDWSEKDAAGAAGSTFGGAVLTRYLLGYSMLRDQFAWILNTINGARCGSGSKHDALQQGCAWRADTVQALTMALGSSFFETWLCQAGNEGRLAMCYRCRELHHTVNTKVRSLFSELPIIFQA